MNETYGSGEIIKDMTERRVVILACDSALTCCIIIQSIIKVKGVCTSRDNQALVPDKNGFPSTYKVYNNFCYEQKNSKPEVWPHRIS